MTFRQIISQYSPVDCKNKLNELLAAVERNFGVFSPDMELDIRSIITVPVVTDYFDRIIHEAHPVLEYDEIKEKPHQPKNAKTKPRPQELTPRQKVRKARKEALKLAKKERDREQRKAIREEEIRKSKRAGKLSKTDYALKQLAKNGRDYSKPTLESQVSRARLSEDKDRPKQWMKIVSVPMGGMNKKH